MCLYIFYTDDVDTVAANSSTVEEILLQQLDTVMEGVPGT